MSAKERRKDHDLMPLGQAAIPPSEIDMQLQRLLAALENKHSEKEVLKHLVRESLAGNLLRLNVAEITEAVFGEYVLGDSRLRRELGKLRKSLDAYYASRRAEPEEIRFTIPVGQQAVYVPRAARASAGARARKPEAGAAAASILEPADNAEVHHRVAVRGRIDALDLDLRAWLVVKTPGGDHYPQCRVRRSGSEWEEEVRIGRLQWGADEDAVYEIMLVAADADGDASFYQYLKSGRDGFGPLLPTDCAVLDTRPVTRRDLRARG